MQLIWKNIGTTCRKGAALLAFGGLLTFASCGNSDRTPNDGQGAGTQGDKGTSPGQGPYTGAGQGTADGADTLGNHPPTSADGMGAGTGVGSGSAGGSSSQTADTVKITKRSIPGSASNDQSADDQPKAGNKKPGSSSQPRR